jgi:uncharacterized protein
MLFIRRPVALFLALTFGWAWLLWGYWVFAMPPGGLVLSPAFLVTAIVGGLAPSLAALAVLGLTHGPRGVTGLVSQLADWSRHKGWYLAALLLGPFAIVSGWLVGAVALPHLIWPDLPALVPVLLVWPALAALGEELGWRGFLYPRLEARLGWLGAAFVLGVIWGVWHLPADFVALKASGDWFWLAFLLNGPIVLTGHALVMAWLWSRTGGSLVAMVLYHLGVTASAIASPSAGPDIPMQLALAAIGAGTVWLLALALHLVAPIRKT